MVDTLRGHGTGWLIEDGLIVTNEHVVRGSIAVIIRQSLHPPFAAVVVAANRDKDIALLRFDHTAAQIHPNAVPLALGQIGSTNAAETLLALGYSGSGIWPDGTVGSASANVGVLSQVSNFGSHSFGANLKMDAPVDPGDSGGPVLNARGEVVGMVRSAEQRTFDGRRVVGTFYAVHVDEIRNALPELKQGKSQ
jgi:S1-C subfamily serine protease